MKDIFPLAPKMTLQFAERAKRGKADVNIGSNIYEFYQGNHIVCIIGLEHPVGHIKKVSSAEMTRLRSALPSPDKSGAA